MPARLLLLLVVGLLPLHAAIEFVWPTPAPVLEPGHSIEEFYQPTASGEPESAGFGCVRSAGHRFHEGIDIKPTKRDRKGAALDEIYAAMDGVVRHINTLAGESSYGRYIVLEHPEQTPGVYTLYAHLSSIAPGLRRGDKVKAGQTLAVMGNTAGGYSIPRDRSHLHFEIGVYATRDFQSWYKWKKFGSPNTHDVWNGMNLIGLDPAHFVTQWKQGKVKSFADYIGAQEEAVRIRIATSKRPDFVQRYPSLVAGDAYGGLLGGWEISFNRHGLPFRWMPLDSLGVVGLKPNQILVVESDQDLLKRSRCKELVVTRKGTKRPGEDLETLLQLLFGLR